MDPGVNWFVLVKIKFGVINIRIDIEEGESVFEELTFSGFS